LSEQLLVGEPTTGIRGISPHKVYPPLDLRRDAVRSYRTFSPLPKFYGFTVLLLYCFIVVCFTFFRVAKKQYNNITVKPQNPGGYFLRHSLLTAFAAPHPLGGVVLCVVRTFLIPKQVRNAID